MWSRSELKEKAKRTFKRYYWKAVLVSFIAFILTGGMGQVASSISDINDTYNDTQNEYYSYEYEDEYFDEERETTNLMENIFGDDLAFFIIGIFLFALCIGLVIKLFVVYPIAIGKNNYFMGIREEEKPVRTLLYVYKNKKLKNTLFTMFMMDLYIFLWTLLLFIPGIIKSYEYRMVPYILCENPDISKVRAFEISKDMMNGNKWDTFVLDLSFIGWYILSIVTLGVIAIFYVNPYVESTNAELYAYLREDILEKGFAQQSELIGF